MQNNDVRQIAGAVIIAGVLIAGAILLKGNTAPTAGTVAAKESTAKKIGLNTKSFQACLASGKFKTKVQSNIDDGVQAGVTGTPSSFILKDGKVVDSIPGAQPMEVVMQQIQDALKNNKTPLDKQVAPVSPDDHIVGNINAKIIIVEYSDLECPFCKVFHNTMHQVVEANNGDVAWVYRHFPIPQLHPKAFRQAEATECAWEQGGNEAFWKYTDRIFEITPSNNGLLEEEL
jgi:protein-disulfide isomerase